MTGPRTANGTTHNPRKPIPNEVFHKIVKFMAPAPGDNTIRPSMVRDLSAFLNAYPDYATVALNFWKGTGNNKREWSLDFGNLPFTDTVLDNEVASGVAKLWPDGNTPGSATVGVVKMTLDEFHLVLFDSFHNIRRRIRYSESINRQTNWFWAEIQAKRTGLPEDKPNRHRTVACVDKEHALVDYFTGDTMDWDPRWDNACLSLWPDYFPMLDWIRHSNISRINTLEVTVNNNNNAGADLNVDSSSIDGLIASIIVFQPPARKIILRGVGTWWKYQFRRLIFEAKEFSIENVSFMPFQYVCSLAYKLEHTHRNGGKCVFGEELDDNMPEVRRVREALTRRYKWELHE